MLTSLKHHNGVFFPPLDSSPLILAVLLLPKPSVICATICILYFHRIGHLIELRFHPSGQCFPCSTHRKQSLNFRACLPGSGLIPTYLISYCLFAACLPGSLEFTWICPPSVAGWSLTHQ